MGGTPEVVNECGIEGKGFRTEESFLYTPLLGPSTSLTTLLDGELPILQGFCSG